MIVAAAVCPHPPALLPVVAAGAAGELAGLRLACDEAVGRLLSARPARIVCVGLAPAQREWDGRSAGSLRRFGVDLRVGDPRSATADLPLSLTVGAFLLARAGYVGPRLFVGVPAELGPDACAALGRQLAAGPEPVALLVLADGAAARTHAAPLPYDPAAVPLDDAVERALATADVAGLLAVQPAVARRVCAAGRPAWQVLAGAAATAPPARAEVLCATAPYGVGYVVASWQAAS